MATELLLHLFLVYLIMVKYTMSQVMSCSRSLSNYAQSTNISIHYRNAYLCIYFLLALLEATEAGLEQQLGLALPEAELDLLEVLLA